MKLRLDTLNKKPKVYNIAILTGGVLAALLLLFIFGGAQQVRFSCVILALYFLSVAYLLLRAFFLQMRYNLYSYNTIIYFGFSLFTLSVSITYGLAFFQTGTLPQAAVLLRVIRLLLHSAKTYTMISFPFLLLFSLALVVSNLSLIKHEGFRPVNLLGIVLAFLLIGGETLIYLQDSMVSGTKAGIVFWEILTNLLAAVYLYFECMLLGTMVADAIAARYSPEKDKDFLIILGCAIRKDGTPTPLLRGRLDRALAFAAAQEAEAGHAPVFILSGGQGDDEVISEAECMRRYLAQQGVPDERMLLEDRSTDTAENMRFSKEIVIAQNPSGRVAFSTSNYHVFRSGLKARRVKLRALGIGVKTKWYFWPNAAVREFVGLLTQHRIKQGLILSGLIVTCVGLTILYYHLS